MQKLTIVKVGGKIVEEQDSLSRLMQAFASIPGPKALVHGGGRSATKLAEQLGIPTRMVNGRRITDSEMLRVVTMVYAGLVNKNIVAKLQSLSVNAIGLTGADLGYMLSDKRPLVDGIDYGFVGDVRKVDTAILSDLISRDIVPVLSPITHDGKGQLLNTNADTIAGEAAKALARDFDVTLTFCFEKKGVLLDPDDDDSVIPVIHREDFTRLVADNVISDGMIPKLKNSFDAIDAGVKRVLITRADSLGLDSGTLIE